eukprot:NODE_2792_length_1120_cov_10.608777_g2563_i0.p1 GENE.NODE_2792_length_1120_cov_10.608777_g2563_i0~~NODE_2792_length_1120_cov_10.608777_g2563_i0.p1  ORF type:complete len:218 (-),score=54.29 NODE_2792_length_1120_cov_10.608777_g2563_i0:182-835(-)
MSFKILYAVVTPHAAADGVMTVECRVDDPKGRLQRITRKVVERLQPHDARTTFTYEDFLFHSLIERGMIFLCVTDAGSGQRIAFQFLAEIKADVTSLMAMGKRGDELQRVVRQKIASYNDGKQDKLKVLRGQVDDVKMVMMESIEKLAERGEKIELLVDKTTLLNNSSQDFRKKAKAVKRSMCAKNFKLIILMVFLLLCVGAGVFLYLCSGVHCIKG